MSHAIFQNPLLSLEISMKTETIHISKQTIQVSSWNIDTNVFVVSRVFSRKKKTVSARKSGKTGRVQGMWWQEEKRTPWFEASSGRTGRRITIESEGSWKIRGSRLKSRLNMISFSFSFRLAYESRRYSALCAIWIKARVDAYLLGIPILQLSVSRASSPCSPSAPFPPHPVHHGRCRVGCGHTYAREID